MPQYDAGSAAIKVKPNLRGFVTELETELRRINANFDVNVGADTRVAAAEIENLRRLARENATFRVDANTATAAAEIEALRRAAQQNMTLRPEVDGNASNRARRHVSSLGADLRKAGSVNLTVLGVVGAAGAIAQLASITDAAAKAVHTVGLIPAIGFGGLAGVGAVATGFSGLPAAFKAAAAASKDASDAAVTQRNALQDIAEAEYQKSDADRSAVQSQQSLNDSYREASRSLRDMNDNLVDQKFAVQDAALSVQEAAQRLQKVQFDPTADSTTRARALLTYQQAVQRLKEQQQRTEDLKTDTAEANTKGVEGSKQVTDAKQRVIEATHSQDRAEQALAKSREAANKPSSGASKRDEAMENLSPHAKELVNDVRALGPAWTEARKASQDALTEGMGPAVTRLAEVQLPGLKDGLTGINGAINSGLRGSLAALSSDANKADFRKALDNTTTGFANAARGSEAWTNSLTKLITVGTQFFPGFGTAIANAGDRFNNLIQRTAADGSLKKWLQEGVDTTKELFEILGHVGSSFASVFRAAGDDGATLKRLEELTDRMSKFLKSTEGQDELKHFFAEARADLEKIKPVLNDLPSILHAVYEAFRTWSAITLPFLNAAGSLLGAHPGLVQTAVIAYLAFKTIGPIFDLVRAGIARASLAMGEFRAASAAAAAAGAGSLRSAAVGLGAVLGPAGIFGLAIIAASAGLSILSQRHAEAARAADQQRQREEALQATLDKGTGAVTKETLETAGKELQSGGFFGRSQSFGIDPQTFLRASLGLADADKAAINAQLTQTIVASLNSKDSFTGPTGTKKRFESAGLNDADVAAALQGVPEAVQKYADAIKKYNEALAPNQSKLALPDLANLKSGLDDVGESAATLGGKMNGYATEVGSAGQKQQELNSALNGSFQLTEQGKKQFTDLGVAVQSVPDAKTITVKALTEEQQRKVEELGATVERLPGGVIKIDLNDAQAKADITAITTAPYSANVNVNFKFPQSLSVATLEKLHENIDNVPIAPGHATGGFLPTNGPGTRTRDGFLGVLSSGAPIARLDGGEAITRRDMANRYRGELTQINAGTFPKLPGYEAGGFVDERPYPARVDDNGNIVYPDQAGKGKQSPIGRAGALATFMQSRNGQPYGGNEDCSGYISEGANVAVGLPSNQGRMSTANEGPWLSALGFQDGSGPPGSFRVGWINDPNMAAGGHTAGTLPNNVNVESGGATSKVMYGGQAIGAGASMFTQHAYLVMDTSSGGGAGGLAGSITVTGQSQLNPQAALPGRRSDSQLQELQGKAAVDSANSERNAVYANPNATEQDKLAADIKYQQAQNSLESSQKQSGSDTSAISLQGFFSKAGGILANGLLSAFGLENSVLSESNVYNRAFNSVVDFYGNKSAGGGYGYTPQNLPSIATTSTPQSSASVTDPSLATQIPGAGPVTGGAAVNPYLGSTDVNVNVPGRGSYNVGAGSAQWRGLALQALQREGFSPGQVDIMLAQIQSESGGNPGVVQQVQDVNSGGNEAVGLLQVIPGTFAQYRDPTLPNDRTNPMANMVAALRYYRSRYGSDLSTMWGQGHGYADGGWVEGIGGSRGDGLRARVSPGEFVVNAFDAARNGPTLEAINSSSWSPTRIDAGAMNRSNVSNRGGHDFSTTIVEPRVANVSDLADLVERQAQMKAIGLMAAL